MASIRDSLAGEPPAYTPTTPPFTYQRSIHDIRAQIHANGSILIPFSNDLSSMEVIVARTGPEGMAGGAGMEAATATSGIKHYAVLIHRSGVSYSIKWAYKGEPRDSVEEALQALLDLTETMLHRRIPSYAYTDKVGRCVVIPTLLVCAQLPASLSDRPSTHHSPPSPLYRITTTAMSHLTPTAARQALRQCSRRLSPASPSFATKAPRAYIASRGRRNYVSESSPKKATVSVESTIRQDHKAFLAETGLAPKEVQMPSTGMSADAMMSPAAGILKQATVMDEGTRPIYLDMQATTPTDPRVLDAMLPFFTGLYGNPHSRTHAYGWETDTAVEQAREHIAKLIGADAKEIIFTSGATESNNMSIKGVARFFKRSGKKNHLITCQTEHKCVLDSCRHLQDEGFEVTYLPVQANGLIDMEVLEKAIRPETCLVSIMTVNNEIGVIQPVEEIGKLCRSKKVFFHTDAAQALGKIPIDVNAWNVDLMSLSAHKIYGPNGIGACYVRRRPRVRIDPIISGGGQERGLRSGTLAPALSIGFGEAARICLEEMDYDSKRISALSERLTQGLLSMEHTSLNGDPLRHYPGCVNVSFAYVEGESLLMALKDIALSSGSACTSSSLEPSYVLRALGNSDESAHSSIRFGIGRFTTDAEIDYVLKAVRERVSFLRELSPLWEMVQDGIDLKSIEWSQH